MSPTGMSVLSHYNSPGCKSTRIITISQHRPMKVLAPAGRPVCSAQPPNGFSEELVPMQGASGSAFPSHSLSAYHGMDGMAVKRKYEESGESYTKPHVVKLGSYEAVEIPPSNKKKKGGVEGEKKKRNDGLDQVQVFDVCSEPGSPGDSCTFNAPVFLYWAQTPFFPHRLLDCI